MTQQQQLIPPTGKGHGHKESFFKQVHLERYYNDHYLSNFHDKGLQAGARSSANALADILHFEEKGREIVQSCLTILRNKLEHQVVDEARHSGNRRFLTMGLLPIVGATGLTMLNTMNNVSYNFIAGHLFVRDPHQVVINDVTFNGPAEIGNTPLLVYDSKDASRPVEVLIPTAAHGPFVEHPVPEGLKTPPHQRTYKILPVSMQFEVIHDGADQSRVASNIAKDWLKTMDTWQGNIDSIAEALDKSPLSLDYRSTQLANNEENGGPYRISYELSKPYRLPQPGTAEGENDKIYRTVFFDWVHPLHRLKEIENCISHEQQQIADLALDSGYQPLTSDLPASPPISTLFRPAQIDDPSGIPVHAPLFNNYGTGYLANAFAVTAQFIGTFGLLACALPAVDMNRRRRKARNYSDRVATDILTRLHQEKTRQNPGR